MGTEPLTPSYIIPGLKCTMGKKSLENNEGKGQNATDRHFFSFS